MSITIKHSLARVAGVLLFAMLTTTGAWAQETAMGIVIWLNDGSKCEVLFASMPEFEYQDGYVTMKSSTTEMSWPLTKLQKLTFEDMETGIRDIKATGLDLHTDHFDAYDISGKRIRKGAKSLSELPTGTYIVKDGSVTIKVVRK